MQNAFINITEELIVIDPESPDGFLVSVLANLRPVDQSVLSFLVSLPVPAQNTDWRQAITAEVVAEAAIQAPEANILYVVFPGFTVVEIPQQ